MKSKSLMTTANEKVVFESSRVSANRGQARMDDQAGFAMYLVGLAGHRCFLGPNF